MPDYAVYLVTDEPGRYPSGTTLLDHVAAAIDGGVSLVQFRGPAAPKVELYGQARRMRDLTRSRGVPLIINDHVDLALAVDADGAHVGQRDLPVEAARRVLGPGRLLGLSITSLPEYSAAACGLLDYLGVGPVFPTESKSDAAPATGIDLLRVIAERSPIPIVAIGGITIERAREVFAAGAAGVAVISALSQAADPAAAARALRAACTR